LKRYLLALPLTVFALAACGGGESEEARVEAAIESVAFSGGPIECAEPMTTDLREKITGLNVQGPPADCEEDGGQDGDGGEEGEIEGVEIDGSTATAQITGTSGLFDALKLEVALVLVNGEWRLSELVRFVELDKEAVAEGLEERLVDDDLTARQRRCFAATFASRTQEQLEEAVLHFQPDALRLELSLNCPARQLHGSDEQQIEATIREAVVNTDPDVCAEFLSQRYLEESFQKPGLEALAVCRAFKEQTGRYVDQIDIVDVAIHGDTATATAVPSSDGNDTAELRYTLAKESGRWKLDRPERLAEIDLEEVAAGLKRGIVGKGVEVTPAASACIDGWVRGRPRADLEDLLTDLAEGKLQPAAEGALRDLADRCFGAAQQEPGSS
jgi:hypothetical protein